MRPTKRWALNTTLRKSRADLHGSILLFKSCSVSIRSSFPLDTSSLCGSLQSRVPVLDRFLYGIWTNRHRSTCKGMVRFHGCQMLWAKFIFQVMGRAVAHLVRAFDEKIALNFDCISLHLCICLCDKFHRLLTEREIPSMSGWVTLCLLLQCRSRKCKSEITVNTQAFFSHCQGLLGWHVYLSFTWPALPFRAALASTSSEQLCDQLVMA